MLKERIGLDDEHNPFTDLAGKLETKDLLNFSTSLKKYTRKEGLYMFIKCVAYITLVIGVVMICMAVSEYLGYPSDVDIFKLFMLSLTSVLSMIMGFILVMEWIYTEYRSIAMERLEKDMEDFYRKD